MANVIYSAELEAILRSIVREDLVAQYLLSGSTTTSKADYVGIKGDQLTFLPTGRVQGFLPDGSWSPDGRQIARPARVARMLITPRSSRDLDDYAYESFTNRIKAIQTLAALPVEEVRGDPIMAYYHHENYGPNAGTLVNSCMRYDHSQEHIVFYADRPDLVRLVLIREASKPRGLLARALVWETRLFGPVMDRAYGSDSGMTALRRYAVAQGWPYRIVRGQPRLFGWGDQQVEIDLDVPVGNDLPSRWPYLDTFQYLHARQGFIANHTNYGATATLNRADGVAASFSSSRSSLYSYTYPDRGYDAQWTPEAVRARLATLVQPMLHLDLSDVDLDLAWLDDDE